MSITPSVVSVEHFLAGPRRFETRTRELGPLLSEWVRLRFLYCGICGSDMSEFEGRRELSYPASLGHEFVAEITDVGTSVDALSPGDIVTSDLNYRCGNCEQCLAGRSHLCLERQICLFSNRAFADAADIHASYLLRIDGAPQHHIALSEPLSCAIHAKQWARLQPTDRILVIGAGGIGLCMAFALCAERTPFDVAELNERRLAMIGVIVAPSGQAIAQPSGEYDVVFDVSGSESGLRTACAHIKPGGRLCLVSHLEGYTTADFLLPAITRKDVTFTVSYINGEWDNLAKAAQLLAEHWSPEWDRLLELRSIDQLQDAFDRRRASPWCKTVIRMDRTAGGDYSDAATDEASIA